jgi:segregation and condensation protein A
MAYELKLHNYEGPLEKLLMLIEERKMSIGDVSLAAVTDDFLKYLESLRALIAGAEGAGASIEKQEEDMRLLADFIVVASRLLLIKSKSLLPDLALTEEEERDIKDLELRLELYQKLKASLRHVDEHWRNTNFSAVRPYFMQLGQAPSVFYPGKNVTKEDLFIALTRVYQSLQKFVMETETIKEVIVSLEEKMKDIAKRMEGAAVTSLKALGGGGRSDMIVAFLAVLHLAREQLVMLEQTEQFADITVRKL